MTPRFRSVCSAAAGHCTNMHPSTGVAWPRVAPVATPLLPSHTPSVCSRSCTAQQRLLLTARAERTWYAGIGTHVAGQGRCAWLEEARWLAQLGVVRALVLV
jgi:hypothetical protein